MWTSPVHPELSWILCVWDRMKETATLWQSCGWRVQWWRLTPVWGSHLCSSVLLLLEIVFITSMLRQTKKCEGDHLINKKHWYLYQIIILKCLSDTHYHFTLSCFPLEFIPYKICTRNAFLKPDNFYFYSFNEIGVVTTLKYGRSDGCSVSWLTLNSDPSFLH